MILADVAVLIAGGSTRGMPIHLDNLLESVEENRMKKSSSFMYRVLLVAAAATVAFDVHADETESLSTAVSEPISRALCTRRFLRTERSAYGIALNSSTHPSMADG